MEEKLKLYISFKNNLAVTQFIQHKLLAHENNTIP